MQTDGSFAVRRTDRLKLHTVVLLFSLPILLIWLLVSLFLVI